MLRTQTYWLNNCDALNIHDVKNSKLILNMTVNMESTTTVVQVMSIKSWKLVQKNLANSLFSLVN